MAVARCLTGPSSHTAIVPGPVPGTEKNAVAPDVGRWLEELKLGKYVELFAKHDIDFDILTGLEERHLLEIGVSIGDRLRLMKAISVLAGSKRGTSPPPPDLTPSVEAERRQLTVMFCDMVGSTALSTRLDPEDLQEVLRNYHDACAKVIGQYNGYVAKYMGDGVLVYFGYPQAHENDPERAASAGLGIVAEVKALHSAITTRLSIDLAVRVGIATGPVVVGDIIGEGTSEEASVVGETPNVAARLQSVADNNQVVVNPLTHDLIQAVFRCEDLGTQHLKGISEPMHAWRVISEIDPEVILEERAVDRGMPLVGRQEELGLLLRSWEATKQGQGQVVLVQGEAGIGKSRLIEALRNQISSDEYLWVAARCSPYHVNSTLYPAIEHLRRALGWKADDSAEKKLTKLEAALTAQSMPLVEAVPLYAELMSLPLPPGSYEPLDFDAKQLREKTLDAMSGWLLDEADRRPVVQLWDDLHWADPTTLELIEIYIEQCPTVSMLNIMTYRPEFTPPWVLRSHVTPITLNRLEQQEVRKLIRHQADNKEMPEEIVTRIIAKADGVPLYVEELTKTILKSHHMREDANRYTLTGTLSELSIPETLQDSLMARLDQFPQVRELAQFGAVLGREFPYEMLQGLVKLDESNLTDGLGKLVDAELLYQRGRAPHSKYVFKHALIQDAAYSSLLNRNRRKYHEQVAQLMESHFPETVETHPELAAHHYTEGGNPERAVSYWRKAGERARRQSANLEAIAYLTNGILILHQLPENESRDQDELAMQVSLGHAYVVAKGHGAPGAETAYARALQLCELLGVTPEFAPTLFGLWRFYVVARPLSEAYDVALRLQRLANDQDGIELDVIAHYALGYTTLCQGMLTDAREHLTEGIAQYRPEQRHAEIYLAAQDPGVACICYQSMTDWLLGYPDKAWSKLNDGIRLAEELEDGYSLAYALCFPGAIIAEATGGTTAELVERGLQVAGEGGFALWIAFAKIHQANLSFRSQPGKSTLDELQACVDAIPRMGVHINTPYFMSILATGYGQLNRPDEGIQVLEDALASADKRGEHWWSAEIYRLMGEMWLASPHSDYDHAATCFQQAQRIATKQNAVSLELRAITSLTKLMIKQGAGDDAQMLLSTCLNKFSEGFETIDLVEARNLQSAS